VPDVTCHVIPLRDGGWAPAADVWNAVYQRMPDAGPYLAPLWAKTWVEVFGPRLDPHQFIVRDPDGAAIGTGLLTRTVRRHAMVAHSRLHLNTDGEPAADSVVVQHNAVLSVAGQEGTVANALARCVTDQGTDEFRAAGVSEAEVRRNIEAFDGWIPDTEWREAPYVDLDRLRADGGDHLRSLSPNTRQQLRRSLAMYRRRGDIVLEAAQTADDAEQMLRELIALHNARWHARGGGGGFASPLRRQFHTAFVRAGVTTGNAQLLRVRVAGETIGVLYNLVANGRVNFYQSGLRYEDDRHLKPGMVVHHLAIMHNLGEGHAEYDFLTSGPGAGRYKTSLANSRRQLALLTLYRPGARRTFFTVARAVRDTSLRLQRQMRLFTATSRSMMHQRRGA
jgi:hypothetical protein